MTLTSCQQKALDNFKKFLITPHTREFLLTGMGGSGKSFLIPEFLKAAVKMTEVNQVLTGTTTPIVSSIHFASPTHKAASILTDYLSTVNSSYHVQTIHSLFRLKRVINEDTGKEEYFKPKNINLPFDAYSILFIEESSMVGEYLHKIILKYYPKTAKIVWLGDILQLPPVKESIPAVLVNTHGLYQSELVTPVRFDNPELIALNQELRTAVVEQRLPKFKRSKYVYSLDKNQFIQSILQNDFYNENIKVLAWTNKKVGYYNKLIKEHIFQGKPSINSFHIDERIVAKKTIINPKYSTRIHSQAEMVIKDIQTTTLPIENELLEFSVLSTTRGQFTVPVNHSKALQAIQHLKKSGTWKKWYEYNDEFAQLFSPYSFTIHQSQGSTYSKIYVDLPDILKNRNKNEVYRLLYVACSRAKSELILLEE